MIKSCIYPWSRMTIKKDIFYICCKANINSYVGKRNIIPDISPYDNQLLTKLWNSNTYQNIRKSMAEDGIHESCFSIFQSLDKYPCFAIEEKDLFVENLNPYIPIEFFKKHQLDNIEKTKENYIKKKTIVDNYPITLEMIIDFYCNSRCIMCHQRHHRKNSNNMYEFPIDKIRENLVEFIHYAGVFVLLGGEPTISPNYDLILEIVKEANGAKIDLLTNGQLLEREVIPYMNLMGSFVISADAATVETYSKIRKGLSFDILVDGVKKLVKFKENRQINIHNTILNINYKEMPDMANFWFGLGVDKVSFAEACFPGNDGREYSFSNQEEKDSLKKYVNKTIEMCKENKIRIDYFFPSINIIGGFNPTPQKHNAGEIS